jgi:hypothetical protein
MLLRLLELFGNKDTFSYYTRQLRKTEGCTRANKSRKAYVVGQREIRVLVEIKDKVFILRQKLIAVGSAENVNY